MAAAKEDFLYGEDLNAILEAIDEDILLSNSDFDVELTTVVNDIPEEDTKVTFSCSLCPKVCVSKRGLTRHTNAKHSDHDKGDSAGSGERDFKEAEKMLHPLYFKKYMEEAVSKLAGDECYPSEITNEFKMFKVGGLDNVLPSYALVKDLI
ncbi:uncharacterized protein LOC130647836 [Hydractinia symbiolongicarpus]|uniref:uncharacterized protein LOC130614415 n=1 Tax=Hydractinia symbiolongicarpus TaxID=13093 RepID=UPI00254E268C|nr:uncharacterized protein LOC130614415 [Hydractinia symbiolongicarpus]XP_057309808.1 uncharacterized protein LOC130647836 [Hydractinia symbiolongicarpus]